MCSDWPLAKSEQEKNAKDEEVPAAKDHLLMLLYLPDTRQSTGLKKIEDRCAYRKQLLANTARNRICGSKLRHVDMYMP